MIHIETLKGIKESESSIEREETTMSLKRFWGGERGRMLEIAVNNSEGYIQFTEYEAIVLAKTLLNSFDDKIYTSK